MNSIELIVLVVVAMIGLGYLQRIRGGHAGRTSGWELESALPPDELDSVIVSGLKGYSPVARVHGSLVEGGYQRRVLRWAMQATSKATVIVEVHGGPTTLGTDYAWTLSASISDWEIEHVGGMAHPLMSAPLAARRRLSRLRAAILAADLRAADPADAIDLELSPAGQPGERR